MSQLDVLREIQRRLGGDEFVKLEIGNHENYLPVCAPGTARIVIIKDGRFFPALLTDDEWDNPNPVIEQLVSWVNDENAKLRRRGDIDGKS